MNDYQFGNKLFSLRAKSGLSQSQLAERIGVTNKAVSKWENGRAKPTTKTLNKLAVVFNIPLEEMFDMATKKGARPSAKSLSQGVLARAKQQR